MGSAGAASWAARATVPVTAGLALLQAWWAWGPADGTLSAAVLAPLTLLAALALLRVNSLETRLAVALMAGAQLGTMLLAVVVGLPGQERHAFDATAVAALALPLIVFVLLDVDRHARCARRARTAGAPDLEVTPPYAR